MIDGVSLGLFRLWTVTDLQWLGPWQSWRAWRSLRGLGLVGERISQRLARSARDVRRNDRLVVNTSTSGWCNFDNLLNTEVAGGKPTKIGACWEFVADEGRSHIGARVTKSLKVR